MDFSAIDSSWALVAAFDLRTHQPVGTAQIPGQCSLLPPPATRPWLGLESSGRSAGEEAVIRRSGVLVPGDAADRSHLRRRPHRPAASMASMSTESFAPLKIALHTMRWSSARMGWSFAQWHRAGALSLRHHGKCRTRRRGRSGVASQMTLT